GKVAGEPVVERQPIEVVDERFGRGDGHGVDAIGVLPDRDGTRPTRLTARSAGLVPLVRRWWLAALEPGVEPLGRRRTSAPGRSAVLVDGAAGLAGSGAAVPGRAARAAGGTGRLGALGGAGLRHG